MKSKEELRQGGELCLYLVMGRWTSEEWREKVEEHSALSAALW